MKYGSFALSAVNYVKEILGTIAELQKRDDWNEWKTAIEEDEINALQRNHTWTLVRESEGRLVVSAVSETASCQRKPTMAQPDEFEQGRGLMCRLNRVL